MADGRDALAYLIRYEAMVRQQEAEDKATASHLRPIFARIRKLGAEEDVDGETLSAVAAGRALADLEGTSAGGIGGEREGGRREEHMATDLQLMYMLQLMVESSVGTAEAGVESSPALTFAEFVLAYKIVVGGMQCLQRLPPSSLEAAETEGTDAAGGDGTTADVRSRVTDRVAMMLRSFTSAADAKAVAETSKPDDFESSTPMERKVIAMKEADGSVRKLAAVKDKQLVRILEEHSFEMDEIAHRIQDTQDSAAVTIKAAERRKSAWALVSLTCVVSFCILVGRRGRYVKPPEVTNNCKISSEPLLLPSSNTRPYSVLHQHDVKSTENEQKALTIDSKTIKVNVKLDKQMIELEERVSTLLASKKHAETEFKRVEKSMLEGRDELLAHLTEKKSEQAKLEENIVMLRSENNCAEKHVRDVEKREESLLKERNDLLERSTEERAQKEEEIVKLNDQIIKLEEGVASLLASKEHAETELSRVEKSMLKDRDE